MKLISRLQITSIISAIIASSCCWLPFVLLIFGISSSTIGCFLSKYKLVLNILALILLLLGFYLQYFQKVPKKCCTIDKQKSTKLQRVNEISLWLTSVLVLAFLLFPFYQKYLSFGKNESPTNNSQLLNKINKLEKSATEKSSCCPN